MSTPFEISVLLHYYTSHTQFRDGDFSPPILKPTLDSFVSLGLLKETAGGYAATEATKVYAEALQNVPLPVQRWVTPRAADPADGG